MIVLDTSAMMELALDLLEDLGITVHDPVPLIRGMWALRNNLTVHNAVYVVLAELLDAPLATGDVRLANAPGGRAVVDLVTA